MRTTKKERLSIGEQIYTHVLTISQAADKYNINPYTARSYMREYRDFNNLPPMNEGREEFRILNDLKRSKYEDLQEMDKEALIDEVIKARVEAERSKKGYLVKGGGQEKVFVNLKDVNSK